MTALQPDKIAALLALLIVTLLTIHLSQDVVFGYEAAGIAILAALPVTAIWLYATLALAGRRSGYILLLLGSFFAAVVPAIHMSGRGIRAEVVQSSGGLFFIWVLIALTTIASLSVLLSIHGLWRVRQSLLGFALWTFGAIAAGGGLFYYLVFA